MTARTFVWTGFIAFAAFALMLASQFTLLDPVENLTLNVTSPLQAALSDATRPMADWVNNLTAANELSEENKRLRAENERLTNDLALARENAIQTESVADLQAVQAEFPDNEFLLASVVERDASNLRSVVAINKGAGDGVREGMIVVTQGRSLVGTVTKVLDDYAWVTLITDPKSAVSAIVQESRAEGVVAGNYDGSLIMEFVGQGAPVKEGDFILTSGVGGGYPPDILIGRVSDVETEEQDLFQQVRVDHLASLSGLEHVLVRIDFVPRQYEGP
jgi:rod shape-determining protein MreC